jgi:hypothetical protein
MYLWSSVSWSTGKDMKKKNKNKKHLNRHATTKLKMLSLATPYAMRKNIYKFVFSKDGPLGHVNTKFIIF